MKRLSVQQVILMHGKLIEQFGGISGIRDLSLLESALAAPFITFDGYTSYPTIHSKAARLAYGLIKNHPFLDGNKRIGVLGMMTFLRINGIELMCTNAELISIGIGLANGSLDDRKLLDFIIDHC